MHRYLKKLHLFRLLLFICLCMCCLVELNAQVFVVENNDTLNYMDKDSIRHGLWREYYATGNIKSEVYYTNGKKDGLELYWYNIPHCLESEINYKNGVQNGIANYYSRWCNIDRSENYSGGKKTGEEILYHSNGVIKAKGEFKDGELIGQYKIYDKKGTFEFESVSTKAELDLNDTVQKTGQASIGGVIDRNSNWKNTIIVTDVTGSMYPYAKQLLDWFKVYLLKENKEVSFTFFNDGDRKAHSAKRIGSTGGIYFVKSDKWKPVKDQMLKAIKKGGGGDAPENDIEAIIKSIRKYPQTTEVILIADNTAPVKDISLLKNLKIPVHIILCGYKKGRPVWEDYVAIACYTGGSLHTLEKDLCSFPPKTDNTFVEVEGFTYKINKGLAKLVYFDNQIKK